MHIIYEDDFYSEIYIDYLSDDNVEEIFSWKYPQPYDVYNMPSIAKARANEHKLLKKEQRDREFFGLYFKKCFIGYFHLYMPFEKSIMLGIGLSPAYCGLGYGLYSLMKIVEYVKINHSYESIVLVVRDFNYRVIKCYEKVGFVKIGYCEEWVNDKKVRYQKMELQL